MLHVTLIWSNCNWGKHPLWKYSSSHSATKLNKSDKQTRWQSHDGKCPITLTPAYQLHSLIHLAPLILLTTSDVSRPSSDIIQASYLTQWCASVTEFGRSYEELDESEYNYIKVNSSFCNPSRIGQWDVISNCQRFYTCEVNSKPPSYCDTEYGRATSSADLVRSAYI